MVISATVLAILAALGLVGGAASGIATAVTSKQAADNANATNVQLTRETNAQNQYNIEHAHQIEMADLQAAGLNPVLTATGGNGAPIVSMNTPRVNPAAPDLSGIHSAFSGLSNMAMLGLMAQYRMDVAQERNNTLTAIANSRNATSTANAVLRKETLDSLYKRKASMLNKAWEGSSYASSAKQISQMAKEFGMTKEEFLKMVKTPWVNK